MQIVITKVIVLVLDTPWRMPSNLSLAVVGRCNPVQLRSPAPRCSQSLPLVPRSVKAKAGTPQAPRKEPNCSERHQGQVGTEPPRWEHTDQAIIPHLAMQHGAKTPVVLLPCPAPPSHWHPQHTKEELSCQQRCPQAAAQSPGTTRLFLCTRGQRFALFFQHLLHLPLIWRHSDPLILMF